MNSLSAVRVVKIAAGLWHTLCVSDEGRVYVFGGNQFGQLGTGTEQAEVHSKTYSISSFFSLLFIFNNSPEKIQIVFI